MPSVRGAKTGLVIIGLAIGASLQANINTIISSYTAEDRNQQIIATGDFHFATNDSQTPAITLDGTDVMTFTGTSVDILANGASALSPKRIPMAKPATNVNQYIASALSPYATKTGSLLTFVVACGDTPSGMTYDVVEGETSTGSISASGRVLIDNQTLGTGSSLVFSGATIQIGSGHYLNLISASGAETRGVPDCDLIPYWIEH